MTQKEILAKAKRIQAIQKEVESIDKFLDNPILKEYLFVKRKVVTEIWTIPVLNQPIYEEPDNTIKSHFSDFLRQQRSKLIEELETVTKE